MSRLIALLTDFGTTDTYVGVMKGVMLGINPDLQLVDLTHAIQPQNIKQAAFILLNSYRFFPPHTIFLVVVDPGVGSTRRPIAVQAGDYTFVAPDNGVLSYTLRDFKTIHAVELTNPAYQLTSLSRTFHGRDLFAPAAAHLSSGVSLEQFGDCVEQPIMLPEPLCAIEDSSISGEVLHIDHFGSAVTSIGVFTRTGEDVYKLETMAKLVVYLPIERALMRIGRQNMIPVHRTYAEVAKGEPLALIGSSGYLELSINQGDFAEKYGIHIGDPVEIQFADRIK